MEESRRSLRNNSHCSQIENIFNPNIGKEMLFEKLPPQLIPMISTTAKTSCTIITQLPILNLPLNIQEEQKRVAQASEYQQSWSVELEGWKPSLGSDDISLSSELRGRKPKPPKEKKKSQSSNILQNDDFLEKLNVFIMGDEAPLPSTQLMLDRI